MDPNTNLDEQLRIANRIVRGERIDNIAAEAERLAKLVIGMDDWLRQGGFLPEMWRPV